MTKHHRKLPESLVRK